MGSEAKRVKSKDLSQITAEEVEEELKNENEYPPSTRAPLAASYLGH